MLARFPRRPGLTLVGAVALVIAIANPAAAPPGDLDPTFDGDGKVTTDLAGSFEIAGAVAIQGDGKIVAAGTAADVSGISDFALARYNADGSLDPTFSGDGKVTTDFAGASDEANAISIQGDGKIVAAGVARIGLNGSQDFALARYNANGSLDTTFSGDGKVTTDFAGANDQAHAVAIQGDGKIVAAGVAGDVVSGTNDFGLARYNANGSLDTTFDGDLLLPVPGDGKVTTDFAETTDQAFGVAIQGDGKIVAAGFAGSDFALARYNADGSLDTAFDGDGKVTTDFAGSGSRDEAHAVAIQGDGKIVAAGLAVVSGVFDFALARYNADGSLDTIFSGDGKVTTDFAGDFDAAHGVAIQANRRIVAAGFADLPGTGFDFALARYTCLRRTSRPTSIPTCP